MILSDVGGELLQRFNSNFDQLFPSGHLEYHRNDQLQNCQFQVLPVPHLSNARLSISNKRLSENRTLDKLLQDVVAILLFGSACANAKTADVLSKCEVGDYLGRPKELEQFVKQRYIWVSRITMGSRSNNLGQLAQKFVLSFLRENLGIEDVIISSNKGIPGITHTDEVTNRDTTFDVVVSKNGRYVAIEISFQVTTNSVIERKAGQSQARYNQIERAGYKIAYVIDGAGNFQRETALNTFCSYSHCTVAFSRDELNVLCAFIRGYLK